MWDLPEAEIQPLVSPASAGGLFTTEPPGKPAHNCRTAVSRGECCRDYWGVGRKILEFLFIFFLNLVFLRFLRLHMFCVSKYNIHALYKCASQVVPVVRNPSASAGDIGDMGFPGSGRSAGAGHDNPLQYSYLESSMDRGEESGGLQSLGSQRVGHDRSDLAHM